MPSRPSSEGLRINKVGIWFAIFTFIVLLAATNTGNNGLYLVLALMGGALVVGHLAGAHNVRGLEVEVRPPPELFANRLAVVELQLRNRGRFLPRWWLLLQLSSRDFESDGERAAVQASPSLIPHLPAAGIEERQLEILMRRRGRHRLRSVRVASLFPFGLFNKSVRYGTDLEFLVFPEVFTATARRSVQSGRLGDEASRKVGWGHDLHGLRPYRAGDDPRGIHWKHTARLGDLILKERESEENRRVSIVFDNGVGALTDRGQKRRFERLVSEAATAALDYLGQGFEVALLTRQSSLRFASGASQRLAILETLALIEPTEKAARPLDTGQPSAAELRLTMDAALAGKAEAGRGKVPGRRRKVVA